MRDTRLHFLSAMSFAVALHSSYIKGKGKGATLVQTLRLCTGRKAHRGSRGIAVLFLDHGTRRW